jgi:hypothetical protein
VTSGGWRVASEASRVTPGASREASLEAMTGFGRPKSDFGAIDARVRKWLMLRREDDDDEEKVLASWRM